MTPANPHSGPERLDAELVDAFSTPYRRELDPDGTRTVLIRLIARRGLGWFIRLDHTFQPPRIVCPACGERVESVLRSPDGLSCGACWTAGQKAHPQRLATCSSCSGKGIAADDLCPACGGTGEILLTQKEEG